MGVREGVAAAATIADRISRALMSFEWVLAVARPCLNFADESSRNWPIFRESLTKAAV